MSIFKSTWNRFHNKIFFEACKRGDELQVFSMLREEPELAEMTDKRGVSPLFYAVEKGHNKIAEAILKITNKANDVEPEKGFTPLLLAATNGYIALVRILLEYGADTDAQSIDGITALHNAVYEDQIDIVHMLMEAGADTMIQDKYGNKAIDLASRSDNPEIQKLLRGE